MDQYEGLSLIWSTNTHKIYSATSRLDQQRYIIKMIKESQVNYNKLISQVQIHKKIRDQNIVYLKDSFNHIQKGNKYLVLVIQYCSGGSLDQIISSHELDLVDRMQWLLDIAKGLKYLHDNSIIHCNIQPQNILLARGRLKIGDLGISRYINEQASQDTNKIGRLWYKSPQVYRGQQYGFETDIWSFGLVCLEVVFYQRINQLTRSQKTPSQSKKFLQELLVQQKIGSSSLRKLIKNMLYKDKSKRYKIDVVIQKLQKVSKKMFKSYKFQQICLQLPLQQSNFDLRQPLPEQINRTDPSKQGKKAQQYVLKTTDNKRVKVRYDDYKQSLKITFEQMEVLYQYKHLPSQLKKYFKNLQQLNNLLKLQNNKLYLNTNGSLILSYKQRLEYEVKHHQQSFNQPSQIPSINNESRLEDNKYENENLQIVQTLQEKKYQQVILQLQQERSIQSSYQFGEKKSSQPKFIINIDKTQKFIDLETNRISETELQIIQPSPQIEPLPQENNQKQLISMANRAQAQSLPSNKGQLSSSQLRIIEFQKEIEICQLVDGPQRAILPDHYVILAQQYFKIKNYRKSQQILRNAIDKYAELRLRYSNKCANAFYKLGEIYLELDNPNQTPYTIQQDIFSVQRPLSPYKQKALQEFKQSIKIFDHLKSHDYKSICKVNNKIGELYSESNDLLFAQNCFKNALCQIKDFSGQERHLAFEPSFNLAKLYNRMARHNQALDYLNQCMRLIQKYLDFRCKFVFVLKQLAITQTFLKNYKKSLEYVQKMGIYIKQLKIQKIYKDYLQSLKQNCLQKHSLALLEERDPIYKSHLINLLEFYQINLPQQRERIMIIRSSIEKIPNK